MLQLGAGIRNLDRTDIGQGERPTFEEETVLQDDSVPSELYRARYSWSKESVRFVEAWERMSLRAERLRCRRSARWDDYEMR